MPFNPTLPVIYEGGTNFCIRLYVYWINSMFYYRIYLVSPTGEFFPTFVEATVPYWAYCVGTATLPIVNDE